MLCNLSLRKSMPHRRPPRPCLQAAGLGHPAAHLPPIPSTTGPSCKSWAARGLPPKTSISLEGKTHSSSKAIAQAFNRQFAACPAQHNQALRRLIRDHHCVDPFYRQSNKRGVAAAIRKAGSSTAQRSWRAHCAPPQASWWALPDLPDRAIQPLGWRSWDEKCLFLEELSHNPDIEGREAKRPGSLLPPISLLCPAVKILEWLLLPSIVEALGTRSSYHSFKPRHSTASALLPISARVVSGLNKCKNPSRTALSWKCTPLLRSSPFFFFFLDILKYGIPGSVLLCSEHHFLNILKYGIPGSVLLQKRNHAKSSIFYIVKN